MNWMGWEYCFHRTSCSACGMDMGWVYPCSDLWRILIASLWFLQCMWYSIVWIASWIPFKFCMWLNLWWHGKIKRFEWQRFQSFCKLVTTAAAPLQFDSWLNCGKIHLFMSEAWRWEMTSLIGARDNVKTISWWCETLRPFSAFCLFQHFWLFHRHSFNRFVNKCLSKHQWLIV